MGINLFYLIVANIVYFIYIAPDMKELILEGTKLLSVQKYADKRGVGRQAVYKMIWENRIKFMKRYGHYYIKDDGK